MNPVIVLKAMKSSFLITTSTYLNVMIFGRNNKRPQKKENKRKAKEKNET